MKSHVQGCQYICRTTGQPSDEPYLSAFPDRSAEVAVHDPRRLDYVELVFLEVGIVPAFTKT